MIDAIHSLKEIKTTTPNLRQDVEPPKCNVTGQQQREARCVPQQHGGGDDQHYMVWKDIQAVGTVQENTINTAAAYLNHWATMEEQVNELVKDYIWSMVDKEGKWSIYTL